MWTLQANVVTPNGTFQNGYVTIGDDGRIAHVGSTRDISPQSGDVDGRGFLLLPGFIDLHVHGGRGADFMDGTPDAVRTVLRTHARFGTTGMLATTLTASREDTDNAILAARTVMDSERDPTCARLLGVHLEGPYICAAKRGAQPPAFVRDPDVDEFTHWLELGEILTPQPPSLMRSQSLTGKGKPEGVFSLAPPSLRSPVSERGKGAGGLGLLPGGTNSTLIRRLTLAPELPGAQQLVEMAAAAGVTVSMGHTDATIKQARDSFAWGVTNATHVFNAMPPLHHREPGAAGGALTDERIACEVICDGVHLHPVMVQLIANAKHANGIVLVTDAMRGAGMPDGTYQLGGRDVFVRDGAATFDDGTLAGSVLTMNRAFVNFRRFTGWGTGFAAQMTSENAAAQLGLSDTFGAITPGKQADMVLLHPETGEVQLTVIGGKVAYRR